MKSTTFILRLFAFTLLLSFSISSSKVQAQIGSTVSSFQLDSTNTTHAFLSWASMRGAQAYAINYKTEFGTQTSSSSATRINIARTPNAKQESWTISGVDVNGVVLGIPKTLNHGVIIVIDDLILSVNHDDCGNNPTGTLYVTDIPVPGSSNTICIVTTFEDLCSVISSMDPEEEINWAEILYELVVNGSPLVEQVDCNDLGEGTDERKGLLQELSFEWTTYPNPFSQQISVKIESQVQVAPELTLFDITGRKLIQTQMENQGLSSGWSARINTAQLKPGIYEIILNVAGKMYHKKMIK